MHKSTRHLLLPLLLLPALANAELYLTIVQGLGGAPDYDAAFTQQREAVFAAATSLADEERIAVYHGEAATREALLGHFEALNTRMNENDRLALFLIGHGSFDGETYKFNIPGPDLSAEDLKQALAAVPGSNHLVVNTSSTSGAMVETISGVPAPRGGNSGAAETLPDDEDSSPYLLVAATRNGTERNATHFGTYFAEALSSETADLNKNQVISVQEAFDYATRMVSTWFEDSGRLATEHALLRGQGAAQFGLARLDALELQSEDPLLDELLQERLELDASIEELQLRRNQYSNTEYLEHLQALVLQSAELTERIEAERARTGEPSAPAASGSDRF